MLLLFLQIVTLGMPVISPVERVGKYVKPRDWNVLISDPDIVSDFTCLSFNSYCLVDITISFCGICVVCI